MNRGVQAYLGATFPKLAAILTKDIEEKGIETTSGFQT